MSPKGLCREWGRERYWKAFCVRVHLKTLSCEAILRHYYQMTFSIMMIIFIVPICQVRRLKHREVADSPKVTQQYPCL